MPKRTTQNPQPGWLRDLVKIKAARKAMQLVGMLPSRHDQCSESP